MHSHHIISRLTLAWRVKLAVGVRLAALAPLALVAASSALGAQAPPFSPFPEHTPLNPFVASRSGLYVQPMLPPVAGWPVSVVMEYGSTVERNLNFPDSFLFDAELYRLRMQLRHDFSARWFGVLEWGVAGAHAGTADRFFEDYHELIHFTMEERDTRPRNSYGDRLFVQRLGIERSRQARGSGLSDARLSVGLRAGTLSQTVLAVTAPTAPSASIYSRGVPSISLLQTVHTEPWPRLSLEASGGVGYTPVHGELAPAQRTTFALGSGAARLRLWGRQAVFITLYGQTPVYRDTGFPELDSMDMAIDFGYLWQTGSGRQWRLGLTEDLRRRDPGVDLMIKIGTSR